MKIFNIFFKQNNKQEKKILAIDYALEAEVKIKNQEYKKALKLLNKAIKNNKLNDSFYYQRAFIYFLTKNYTKADNDINKAIQLNDRIYYYFLLKSDICTFINKEEESEYLKQALILMKQADLFYRYKLDIIQENNKDNLSSLYKRKINMLSEMKEQINC